MGKQARCLVESKGNSWRRRTRGESEEQDRKSQRRVIANLISDGGRRHKTARPYSWRRQCGSQQRGREDGSGELPRKDPGFESVSRVVQHKEKEQEKAAGALAGGDPVRVDLLLGV